MRNTGDEGRGSSPPATIRIGGYGQRHDDGYAVGTPPAGQAAEPCGMTTAIGAVAFLTVPPGIQIAWRMPERLRR